MTPTPVGTSTGPGSPPPSARAPEDEPSETRAGSRADPDADAGPDADQEAKATPDASTTRRAATPPPPDTVRPEAGSHFTVWLAGVAAVAAGIQTLVLHAVSHRPVLPAAGWYDTVQARELVRGAWFIDPVRSASGAHLLVPTAAHPPLPTLLLAMADVASATGPTAHMVVLALLFVASVVLAGVTLRDLAGERAGILGALVFATCPLLWINPATVGPETTVIVVTTMLLFAAVRFWARPTSAHAALVGLALGLCALTRTDLVALVVLVGLPLGLLVRHVSGGARIRALAVMATLFLLVVGPWVGRNVALFGHTVAFSQDYGPVVAGANCAVTASGRLEGWWSQECLARVPVAGRSEPRATDAQVGAARTFADRHRGDSLRMAAARLGRVWDLYHPLQSAELEAATGRPPWVSRLGLWYFIGLVPAALVGALVLRRRRLLLFPFVALIVLSSVTAVLAYGDARFAVEADVALAMLAGVALDAAAGRMRRRWSSGPGRHSPGRAQEER